MKKHSFKPVSPYGTSKIIYYWITKNYRTAYNIFAANGILFNHEGPRRGETFVTRKLPDLLQKLFSIEENFFILEI